MIKHTNIKGLEDKINALAFNDLRAVSRLLHYWNNESINTRWGMAYAKWAGHKYTDVVQCYCGNFKGLSGLQCKKCDVWTRFHS